MNVRFTAILFALTTTLVAALLVVVLTQEEKDRPPTGGFFDSLAVTEDQVDHLEIVNRDEKILFVKRERIWEVQEPKGARIQSNRVDDMVRELLKARPVRHTSSTTVAEQGLDKPVVSLRLGKGEKNAVLHLGQSIVGGDKGLTFVTTGDQPSRLLAVKRSDIASLLRDPSKDGEPSQLVKKLIDFRRKKLFGTETGDLALEATELILSATGKELSLVRGSSSTWKFQSPALGEADTLGESTPHVGDSPFTGVKPILNTFATLQVTDEDFIEKPDDLAKYGLSSTDAEAIRVEIKGKNRSDIAFIGKRVEETGKPFPRYFVRFEGDPAVLKVGIDRRESLRQTVLNPVSLRNRELIPGNKLAAVDAIDLDRAGTLLKFRKVKAGETSDAVWVVYGAGEPLEVRSSDVDSLLSALSNKRPAKDILPAPDETAFAKAEQVTRLKIRWNSFEAGKTEPGRYPPEPEVKGTLLELVLGRQEGESLTLRRIVEGSPCDMKFPATVITLVNRTRLEWLAPKLKTFPPSGVAKFSFRRGSELLEIDSANVSAPWVFAKPEDRKGKTADFEKIASLVETLAALKPLKIVTENATPEELKKFGLAEPRVRSTVTLREPIDKETERCYEFGESTEDKQFIYARQVGLPYVFLLHPIIRERFLQVDLRDTVVYRVDPAKVYVVKLRGWAGLNGPEPTTYFLEKKGGVWKSGSPPTPAGFVPDSAKIEELLKLVSAPQAASFHDVRSHPNYGLDEKANPNFVEITLVQDGTPNCVTLVLGAKAEQGMIYAASSGVPGEIFLYNPSAIAKFLGNPTGFQKK